MVFQKRLLARENMHFHGAAILHAAIITFGPEVNVTVGKRTQQMSASGCIGCSDFIISSACLKVRRMVEKLRSNTLPLTNITAVPDIVEAMERSMAMPHVSHSFSRAYVYVGTLDGKVMLAGGGAVIEALPALYYV
jgi:hypothetical protein